MIWEYKIESHLIGRLTDSETVIFLNSLGKKGWQLCSIVIIEAVKVKMYYFKRPAKETVSIENINVPLVGRRRND